MWRKIKYIAAGAAVLCVAAVFAYERGVGSPADPTGAPRPFTVSRGQSAEEVASNLEQAGLIGSGLYFKIYLWRQGKQSALQAGDYVLKPSLSVAEIAEILADGRTENKEITIKIIEGWDIGKISGYLAENGVSGEDEFVSLAKNETGNRELGINKPDFLADAPPAAGLEGYLFPDTYRIYRDTAAADIIAKMLDNFGAKLTPEIRSDIAAQNKTIYEIVTMASIIEKEVRSEADMKIVSGIFWNRIEYGQPLESCATLAYILGVNKKQYTFEDTKINSPYNTYQNRGLPPGPIANPGLKAIKAAVYPEDTAFNYFLSPDTGETVFSRTYDEHLANKAKFLD